MSLIVFAVIFARGHDWRAAAIYAYPVALICMIGFIINDLHDVEKDRENHPDRPLPRGEISLRAGAILFFLLLAVTLTIARYAMAPDVAFLYVVGALAMINYNYIVSYLWPLKNAYVGLVATLPLFVIWRVAPSQASALPVAATLFLYVVGAEMLSDLNDRGGDGRTPAKWLGERASVRVAFLCKAVGGGILLISSTTSRELTIAMILLAMDVAFYLSWHSDGHRRLLTKAMLLQAAVGGAYIF